MTTVLVASGSGCRALSRSGEGNAELAGRQIHALATDAGGACVAVVDGQEIWRRNARGEWSRAAKADIPLGSIASVNGTLFGGAVAEAVMVRVPPGGEAKRLAGFDKVPGRKEWCAGGPPLHVRSLTATVDHAAILAAVHVGGIPRSSDGGETWTPTVPIAFDVHEVCAHPSLPNVAAAAAAVGLLLSHDGGRNWTVHTDGLELKNSLAVAVLQEEALFSIQDGPFAERSQVWRWRFGAKRAELVREGLPEWLEGKVDTAHIAAGAGRAAIVDRGGNLWLSEAGSSGWQRIAARLEYVFGLVIL